jgi:hypothetical protein
MVVGVPNEGLRRTFAFDKQKVNVLGFEPQCSFTTLFCSACK